ncbi:MAG: UvrD-helicase domain-containing protein [Planctomycetes bacterium]|nr:UvrD-helicase domain-containing protein [Planctomycetota bacterium]
MASSSTGSGRNPKLVRLIAGLNPEQREAVLHEDGPLLVLAGAGTGKTRVVTVRIAQLMSRGHAPQSILAVTFTNKAAREMRDRVAGHVGKKVARELTITTFHSFALRELRAFGERLGYRKNFTIADEEDRLTLLRSILRDLGVSEKQLSAKQALWTISGWKNEGLGPEAAHATAGDDQEDLAARAYAVLGREMAKRQTVDFDDMILLLLRLYREHPDVLDDARSRYRYLLVDEYQDTNGTQYEVVRALAGGRRNLCVVGDDDQSIYGWRGARAGNILDFAKHYHGARVVTLAQNYRSTNRILRAANAVITNNVVRREKTLWSALGEGEPVCLYEAADERDEVLQVCTRISALRRGGIKDEAIAILFRANTQSNPLEAAMRERQIPYRIVGTRSLFDRREPKDLLAYLKLSVNPSDDGALLRVLNVPARGIGKTSRDRLLEMAVEARSPMLDVMRDEQALRELTSSAAQSVRGFVHLIDTLRSQADREGVAVALSALTETIGYRHHLEVDSKDALEAQTRWNVVEQLLEISRQHVENHGLADSAQAFLEALALDGRSDDRKDDDKGHGITLMTVHAAKGLEFDNVFLVGVEEGIFPHKNALGGEDGLDTIDEERRLFYVAITRARHRLEMSLARTRRKWGRDEEREPSRFLAEIGEEGFERNDAASQGPADDATAGDYLAQLKNLFG